MFFMIYLINIYFSAQNITHTVKQFERILLFFKQHFKNLFAWEKLVAQL